MDTATIYVFIFLILGKMEVYLAQYEDSKLDLNVGTCELQVLAKCNDEAIKFYFYSSLEKSPQLLNSTDPKVPSFYIPGAPIKILIHGWAGSLTTNFTDTMRDAYLNSTEPHNIVVVDWGPLSNILCYVSSIVNTRQVATCLSEILAALAKQQPLWDPAYLHLIGHSLGAHIAAFTSNDLLANTGRRVARITGLDPALPGFATLWLSAKLDPSDADFVDVMHTCAGIYGKLEPCGHADFYVNGGSLQPYCTAPGRHPGICSHLISMYYFAESINHPHDFWGEPCAADITVIVLAKNPSNTKWWTSSAPLRCPPPNTANLPQWNEAYMGDSTNVKTRGTFYVKTAATYPFGLGRPANVTKLLFFAPVTVQEYNYYTLN